MARIGKLKRVTGVMGIAIIIWIGCIGVTEAVKCSDNMYFDNGMDPIMNSVMDLTFNLSDTSKHTPRGLDTGPISNHIYYAADVSPELVDNQTTYLARLDDRNSPEWEMIYMYRVGDPAVAIAPDEVYLYSGIAEINFAMMQLDASSGEITSTIYVGGFWQRGNSQIVISPDSSTVYFNQQDKRNYNGVICQWIPAVGKIVTCREFTALNPTRSIVALDNNRVFSVLNNYDYGENPYRDTYMVVTDFKENKDAWNQKIPCTQSQCMLFNSIGFLDRKEDIIYNLVNIQYDTLFFTLDASTGAALKQYIWSDYAKCYGCQRFQRFDDKIYMAYSCQLYFALTVYSISQDRFLASYTGDSSLYNVVFTPLQAFFAYSLSRNDDGHFAYIKRGPVLSVNSMYNLAFSIKRMVSPVERPYTITQNETSVEYNITTPTTKDYSPIEQNTKMVKTIIFNHTSDTAFFLAPTELGNLLNNYDYDEEVSLTCSRDGLSSISYQIGNFSGYTVPEWAEVNGAKGKLRLAVPYANLSMDVKFTIDAIVVDENKPRVYSKLVTMNLKTCTVGDCYRCEKGEEINTCMVCISGYAPNSGKTECSQTYSVGYTKTSGYVVNGFLYAFLLVCFILALLSKVPLQVLWSVVHQYQMILMLPLLGSFIPTEITDKMLMSDFLWRPIGFVNIAEWFQIPVPKDCQHSYHYESQSRLHYDCFLVNFFQVFFPFIIFLLISLALWLVKRRMSGSNHWMITYVLTLSVFMAIILRYFLVTFAFLVHSSIASLGSLTVTTGYNIAALILNLIYLQLAAFLIFVLIRMSLRKINGTYLEKDDRTLESTKELEHKGMTHFYIHAFLGRRLLSSVWIVASQSLHPRFRIGVFIAIQVAWMGYNCLKHFKCRALSNMEIYNDGIYIVLCFMIFICCDGNQWSDVLTAFFYLFISPLGLAVYAGTKAWMYKQGVSSNTGRRLKDVNATTSRLTDSQETELLGGA